MEDSKPFFALRKIHGPRVMASTLARRKEQCGEKMASLVSARIPIYKTLRWCCTVITLLRSLKFRWLLRQRSSGARRSEATTAAANKPLALDVIEIRGVKNALAYGVNGRNTRLITERWKKGCLEARNMAKWWTRLRDLQKVEER